MGEVYRLTKTQYLLLMQAVANGRSAGEFLMALKPLGKVENVTDLLQGEAREWLSGERK